MEIDVASAKTMKEQCHILIHCDRIKMLWNLIYQFHVEMGVSRRREKPFPWMEGQKGQGRFDAWFPYVYFGTFEKSLIEGFFVRKGCQIKD